MKMAKRSLSTFADVTVRARDPTLTTHLPIGREGPYPKPAGGQGDEDGAIRICATELRKHARSNQDTPQPLPARRDGARV